jgi:tripartite-type tricarboxylate transporter receptor subunit TctC
VASLAHLATALFASMAGIEILHVPYKSSAQSMTDIITGRLDMQFTTIPPTLASIRAQQLRPLATTGSRRTATLAEVPTVAESGLRDYEAALWVALVAPATTPMRATMSVLAPAGNGTTNRIGRSGQSARASPAAAVVSEASIASAQP